NLINILTTPSLDVKSSSLLESREKRNSRQLNNYKMLYECLKEYKQYNNEKLISIILPVYNEEKTIKNVLENLPKSELIEVIVVDDHSTDSSLNEIKKVKSNGEIHIIEHKFNQGYGKALLTGIHHSKGEIFITMDSDGQHRPEDIFSLLEPIFKGDADITIGSRYKGTYNYRIPVAKRLGEAFLEVIIILLFGQKVKNNQGGFRAFHRKTQVIFENIRFKGYAFTTELILQAALRRFRIKEVPINLASREFGSSYIILRKLVLMLFLCIGIYFFKKVKRILFKK
ncbi:MAG: glycosyltransferase family 2 protein, partial [Promethearchaeota archaeon]